MLSAALLRWSLFLVISDVELCILILMWSGWEVGCGGVGCSCSLELAPPDVVHYDVEWGDGKDDGAGLSADLL